METVHIIDSIGDFYKCKKGDTIKYFCKKCGRSKIINDFRPERINVYSKFLCKSCVCKESVTEESKQKYRDTCMKKYGVINVFQLDRIKEKSKLTKKEKYGDEHYVNSEKRKETSKKRYGYECSLCNSDVRLKSRQTKKERYGDENYVNSNKSRQTKKERYGDENYCNREKAELTCYKNYGVKYPAQNPEIRKLQKETSKKRYGYECSLCNSDVRLKSRQTKKERYGDENYCNREKISKSLKRAHTEHPERFGSKRIVYNNISFDSIPEFCIYIYCIDAWISIIRNPNICLKYLDMYDKEIFTYPDFMINGRLVEIKGCHYLNPDGTWKFPYNTKKDNNTGKFIPLTEEEKYYMDDLYDRKRICLLQNNVNILYDNNPWVQGCINYVYTTYGKDWIYKYMKSNPLNISYGYGPIDTSEDDEYVTNIYPGVSPFDQKD